jgi:AraC-like DNA-binding protein
MKIDLPIVPARYFAILCDFLDSIGVSGDAVLNEAGLDRENLTQANRAIAPGQLEVLLTAALRISGRTDLAFELGRRIKLNSHDILSCALISCVTLDQLMQLLARYYRLINPMLTMSYQRHGDDAELVFLPALSMTPAVLQFWLEATAVSTYLQVKSVMSRPVGGSEICISMHEPSHFARYSDLNLVRFRFAPSAIAEIRIRIVKAQLDEALPMANANAVRLAEDRCKSLLRNVSTEKSWAEWVGMMLQHAEDTQPMLEDLAKLLNVSARTLDRHLNKEGTSFRELSVRIRSQRACVLLNDGKLTVSQIAYTLGYSDLANFSRSFKKEHGVSPISYRGVASVGVR